MALTQKSYPSSTISKEHWEKQRINDLYMIFRICGLIGRLSQLSVFIFQRTKFSIKDFFSKYGQICRFLRIRSHLLKKLSIDNFIFCAVIIFCFKDSLEEHWDIHEHTLLRFFNSGLALPFLNICLSFLFPIFIYLFSFPSVFWLIYAQC